MSRYAGTYRFRSPVPLPALAAVLSALGPWQWTLRDGEEEVYLLCRPDGGNTTVRIFGEAPDFVVETLYDPRRAETPVSFEELHDTLLDRLLPGIGATGVGPAPREEV